MKETEENKNRYVVTYKLEETTTEKKELEKLFGAAALIKENVRQHIFTQRSELYRTKAWQNVCDMPHGKEAPKEENKEYIKARRKVIENYMVRQFNNRTEEVEMNKFFSEFGISPLFKKYNDAAHYTSCGWNSRFAVNMRKDMGRSLTEWVSDPKIKLLNESHVDSISSDYVGGNITGFITKDIAAALAERRLGYCEVYLKRPGNTNLPLRFRIKNEDYELFSFEPNDSTETLASHIRAIRITRKQMRNNGKWHYYIQFTLNGVSPSKKRTLGKGIIGIDWGLREVAVASQNGKIVKFISILGPLENEFDHICEEINELNKKLDAEARATNPDCFGEDNNRIKGSVLVESKLYTKLKNKRHALYKKKANILDLRLNIIANEIVSMGDRFIWEDVDVNEWSRRKKAAEESNSGGHGKAVALCAPGSLITKIKNRIKALGGSYFEMPCRIAATQYDHTDRLFHKEHSDLSVRWYKLSTGELVHRDCYSAYKLANVTKKTIEKLIYANNMSKEERKTNKVLLKEIYNYTKSNFEVYDNESLASNLQTYLEAQKYAAE